MSKESIKEKAYEIIFESESPAGKTFDLLLLIIILTSVVLVILESVSGIRAEYGPELRIAEWIITIIFSIEYIVRIIIVRNSRKYVFSFFGIIDFLSVVPTYLSLVLAGAQGLLVIRGLRLLRVFRILKLTRYTSEGFIIIRALRASRVKISVFLFAVLMIVIIIGTLMYLIEGPDSGFDNIPVSIYWAIVTLTTVGYGDITPLTNFGKFISAMVMILGYAIIAVPTGIVTAELTRSNKENKKMARVCPGCKLGDHEEDAVFCRNCGTKL